MGICTVDAFDCSTFDLTFGGLVCQEVGLSLVWMNITVEMIVLLVMWNCLL